MNIKLLMEDVEITPHTWISMYSDLANFVLEYSSLDPIWTEDENGDEVMTEDKQDEYCYIVDEVERIMRANGIVKGDS